MISYEKMSDIFHKVHLGDTSAVHFFSGPDYGDPHDHPWNFKSTILVGGYVEERFDYLTGECYRAIRREGDTFYVPYQTIHRIVELLAPVVITRVWAEHPVNDPAFWKWEGGVAYKRHQGGEWMRQ